MSAAEVTKPAATPADIAQELVVMFSRLRRRLRAVTTADSPSPTQTSVLLRLFKSGTSSAAVLAAAEGVRPQSMATVLAALEQQGLIERTPDPEDGRRSLISLSELGRRQAEGDREVRHEWLADVIETRFTAAERQTISAALTLLGRLDEQ